MRSPTPNSDLTTTEQRRARLRGIALMCAGSVCFATVDAISKFLVHDMSSLQVTWARFASAFVASLFICNIFFNKSGWVRSERPGLQLIRSTLIMVANAAMVVALRFLQLDQSVSIMFTTPFIVAALAVPLLGERIGPRRWVAIAIGFCGVLLVMRPGVGGIHPAAFLCLVSAITYSFFSILTRVLSHADSSGTTIFYTNVVGTVVLTAAVPFVWTTPSLWDGVLMVFIGGLATFGHFLLILAHRYSPASILAPFIYTQLVWMVIYGYFLFGDLPNRWTLAGASIVIASGLYLIYRERQVKGPAAPISGDPVA